MTPAQHDPQNDLSRTLSRQAERFTERGGAPIELENVLARAGEIRRGRRMRATMVMAAVVLAIAVPVGIQVVGENDPTSPSDTEQNLAVEPPNGQPLDIDGLTTGAAPNNGYALDGKLWTSDNAPQPLDGNGDIRALARMTGGYLVVGSNPDDGSTRIYFRGDDDRTTSSDWTYNYNGVLTSADGGTAIFVDEDNTVMAVESGADRSFELGKLPADDPETPPSYQPVGLLGENCSGRTEDPAACTVFVTDGSVDGRTWLLKPNAEPEEVADLAGLRTVAQVGQIRGAFMTSFTDDGSCWKVEDIGGGEPWETCRYSLDAFSPDGKFLLAGPAYRSGSGDGSMAILDAATGKPKLELTAARDVTIYDARWEDDEHVLATVFRGTTWAVVRIGLNGYREYAVDKVTGDGEFFSPITLG